MAKTAKQLLNEVQVLLTNRKHTGTTPAVRRRQHTEETLVLAAAIALLDAGYLLGVHDGEETTLRRSRNMDVIQEALFTTDEDHLLVYEDDDSDDPTNVEYDPRADYWVRCTYGNDGWDVISDYTVHLEPVIGDGTAVQELVDKAEEGRI